MVFRFVTEEEKPQTKFNVVVSSKLNCESTNCFRVIIIVNLWPFPSLASLSASTDSGFSNLKKISLLSDLS